MRKIIALLLCITMLLPLLPVTGFAAAKLVATNEAESGMKADKMYYIITPDQFSEIGGWKLADATEAQLSYRKYAFYDRGNGTSPAKIKIVVPEEGVYQLFAHTRDFSDRSGTRTFSIEIDGKEVGIGGNHGGDGWAWQKYENVLLSAGEHELSLIDKDLYARVDALFLTNDEKYVPSNTEEGLKNLESTVLFDASKIQVVKTNPLEGRPADDIAVKFNGEWMKFDVPPVIINSRTMVPMRAIFEALGAAVGWEQETRTAHGTRNGKKVTVTIDSNIATVGGMAVTIDQSAVLKDSRTLVPLRFISEAYDANVEWDGDSRTIFIRAVLPKNMYYITSESYYTYGTWGMDPSTTDGAGVLKGTTPESRADGKPTTIEDADASKNKPAIAEFEVPKAGDYRIWVRARDFKTNQQGTRYFDVTVNGQPTAKTYGKHAQEGYIWEDGGIVHLNAGKNTLEAIDSSGFFARLAGIVISEDLEYKPSSDHKELMKIATPIDALESIKSQIFPMWARADLPAEKTATIETESVKVNFYKATDATNGSFVQNEIYSKDASGNWVLTKAKTEEFGYMILKSSHAKNVALAEGNMRAESVFNVNGTEYQAVTNNLYKMGENIWMIPTDFEQNGNKVTLSFADKSNLDMTVVWENDGRIDPKVTVSANAVAPAHYSFLLSNGREFTEAELVAATMPFRVTEKRVPITPTVQIEQYLATPMGTITVNENGREITKGVVIDGENMESEWVYNDTSEFGIALRGVGQGLQGVAVAPLMGTDYGILDAGENYTVSYRPIAKVSGWFDTYKHVAQNIFDVHDYRSNYYTSLNEAIFNTTDLMMDDVHGGWDDIDLAQYNMEGQDLTTSGNPMIAVQRYLLTEDESLMEERAIPSLAFVLTRGSRNFKKTKTTGGSWSSYVANPPSKVGNPVKDYSIGTFGGLYEMTSGSVPALLGISEERGLSGSGYVKVLNSLAVYRYTNDRKYLEEAKKAADEYLNSTLYSESYMSNLPNWSSFINLSYSPNLAALIDLYEACGEQKYLDAAKEAASMLTVSQWTTGIDNGKGDTPYEVTADYVYNVRDFMSGHTFWWHGEKQWRLGFDDGQAGPSKEGKVKLPESETVPGWLPTRVGLGLEQASTFAEALNIYMSCWAPDFIRLAHYTGDEYFEIAARNAIIGRFGNYPGYYQNRYMTHQMKPNYPYEGPDYTSIYWHHITPFLAMIEEFLITDIWYKSDAKIEFPRVRQQGYAYFDSSQYGFDSGKMYDVDGLWLWNDRDIVNPDSIQIDYLPAKKDGVLAVAFMNEDKVDTTTTITLGNKVAGGASYSGTATVYDAKGNKSTVQVANGKFTITVPKKDILTVVMNIPGVKAPSYANENNSLYGEEIGGTVVEHERGRGYTLQLSGNKYYAYVYITDMDEKNPDTAGEAYRASALNITYTVNGETKTATRNEYPFEFIIPVNDVNAEFVYTVEAVKADGTKEALGGGTLMTKAVSDKKGVKFNGNAMPTQAAAPAPSTPATPSTETKIEVSKDLPKFDPYVVKFSYQGSGGGMLRFIIPKTAFPFAVTENIFAGCKIVINATVKATGEKFTVETVAAGNEMRADGGTTLKVVATSKLPAGDYMNERADTHTLEMIMAMPDATNITVANPAPSAPATPQTPAETPSGKLPEFEPFAVKYTAQGTGNKLLRFVVPKGIIPFECTKDLLKGVVADIEMTETASGKVTKVKTTLAGNEMRADGGVTLLVNPTTEMPVDDYDNDKSKTHKFKITLSKPE